MHHALLSALMLGLAACGGGDQVLQVDIAAGLCWDASKLFSSVRNLIAVAEDSRLVTQPGHECISSPAALPMVVPNLRTLFDQRGYLVRDVDATVTTRVIILLYSGADCRPAPQAEENQPLMCLLSDLILPGGEQEEIRLSAVCPQASPAPMWAMCVGAAPP